MKCSLLLSFSLAVPAVVPNPAVAADQESQILIFGRDINELRQAAAEKHSRPRAIDGLQPVEIEFTIEPEPEVLMMYTADGVFDVDWFYSNPGPTFTIEILPGTYEVAVGWRDTYHKEERIAILENTELSTENNRIEIDGSSVVHELRLVPIGPDGLVLPDGVTVSHSNLRREGCGVSIYQHIHWRWASNLPLDQTTLVGAFSTLSDNYSFEYYGTRWDIEYPTQSSAYSYSAEFRGGITDDETVEIQPDAWNEITIRHHPEPAITALRQKVAIPNHPFSNLPMDQLGLPYTVYCWGIVDNTGAESEFEQTVFVVPRDDPKSTLGFLELQMFEGFGGCQDLIGVRPLYRPPYIAMDTGPKGFLLGSSVPVYEPGTGTFHTGLGPHYWFGKIEDRGTEIGISSSHGFILIPFLDQTGCRPGYSGPLVPYELYQDDGLMDSGLLPFSEDDAETVLALDEPGEHTLVLSYDNYWMGQNKGLTTVAATFGIGSDDKNPPYLMRLAVTDDGEAVEHLRVPGGKVEFLAADNASGIVSASAWLDTDTGRQYLAVVPEGKGEYRIDLPTVGSISPLATLSILIEDADGNTLETGMLIPLRRVAAVHQAVEFD